MNQSKSNYASSLSLYNGFRTSLRLPLYPSKVLQYQIPQTPATSYLEEMFDTMGIWF